ncbi:MAG: endolytic transglycosylase MltG [Clostridiales bacterium]|nr:MAG: endolytic transglycosylase MltG [Clostridiales bacterium]
MGNRNQRRSIKPVEFKSQGTKQTIREVPEEKQKSRQIHAPVIETKQQAEKKKFSSPESRNKGKQMVKTRKYTKIDRNIEENPWRDIGRRVLKTAIMVACSLAIVAIMGVIVYNYVYGHYIAPVDVDSTEEISVIIDKDDSLKSISQKLEDAGVIRNSTIFKYYVDFSDMSTKLLAGKFTLSPSMTYDDIINVLKRPAAAQQSTRVTLVEGILIKGMIPKLEEAGVLAEASSSAEFDSKVAAGTDYSDYWFIKEVLDQEETQSEHRDYILEGYLFPDTYEFYISSDTDQVVEKMLNRFAEIYTEDYKKRAAELGMTTDEVITLASIIEKEAGKVEDFAKVSAVFYNRLEQDMMLQSCATLQYFMPEKKFVYSAEETQTPSPYNTYIHKGLPIGPICSPGKAAIEAALWPDEQFMAEGYLYFCAGDPAEGTTVFAKTYEEHKANIAKYESLW